MRAPPCFFESCGSNLPLRLGRRLLAGFGCALLWLLIGCHTTEAAGVVTDCSHYGSGPGTLQAAVAGGGMVTFACSGTIIVPEIAVGSTHLIVDGTGQRVILSGNGVNRIFTVANDGSLDIRQLTLYNGYVTTDGGAAIQSGGALTVTASTLISNSARYGGALEIWNGSLLLANSTVTQNYATGTDSALDGGGALDVYFADNIDPTFGVQTIKSVHSPIEKPIVTIVNSTIVSNSAAFSGRDGLWLENGSVTLLQTIIASSGSGAQKRNCFVEPSGIYVFISTGSLDDDGTCRSAIQAAPRLGPLTLAGATPVYPLLPGSRAIDAIPADQCATGNDQRHILRPRASVQNGQLACDIGAYEYASHFYVKSSQDDGLAGYWKFDESAGGVASDSSEHGFAGTLQGGALFAPAHAPVLFANANALQLAIDGRVQVAHAAALAPADELTVAAWVKADNVAGAKALVQKIAGANGPGYQLSMEAGALRAEVWDSLGAHHVVTGGVIQAGSWMHLAFTWRKGGAMNAYINGVLVGSQPANAAIGYSTAPLRFSANGAIDEVRIYAQALSAAALATLVGGRSCITTGTTWADAVPDLQCALLDAQPGDEIWVTQGRYTPTRGPNRAASFTVPAGVAIYGGFFGGEFMRNQRILTTQVTVLSGDIEHNDRVDGKSIVTDVGGIVGGNALHVVSISGVLTTTVLDGVVVNAGSADGAPSGCPAACGGGITIAGGAPLLHNLHLIANRAADLGGGIYAHVSSMTVVSATVEGNRAQQGGGIYLAGGSPVLFQTLIAGNAASANGGGVAAVDSALRLINVTLGGNRADSQGGGLAFVGGSPQVMNSAIGHNGAPAKPQVAATSGARLRKSVVQGGCPASATCTNVIAADPLFVEPLDPGVAPRSGGNYQLQPASVAIDSGDNSLQFDPILPDTSITLAAISTDLAGAPRLLSVRSITPIIDAGAYEAWNMPPFFTSYPVTLGTTTLPYTYTATAVDPNDSVGSTLVVTATLPAWVNLTCPQPGVYVVSGTPGQTEVGDGFLITLRVRDPADAWAEQSFAVTVIEKIHPLYLPNVRRSK